ncbi:MAG: MotA/TolQ/ExbB proton channel family protein [Thiobacillaceae bacterium]|nr:MotA/TolQ/ExbB proton channel family protein [Thiobacillaceae bacterium]
MSTTLEALMYQVSQLFLIPTLLAISLLFLFAFYAVGAFAVQAWQRRTRPLGGADTRGYSLIAWARSNPQASADDLDVQAHRQLEPLRIATRVAPMLGLVATMIPMGPALKGLSDGNLAQVSDHLVIAFSAVILALIAAALTFWVVSVRRRWLAEELAWLNRGPRGQTAAEPQAAAQVMQAEALA